MFDTLEEQIERTEGGAPPKSARVLRYVGLLVLSASVFLALYLAIRVAG